MKFSFRRDYRNHKEKDMEILLALAFICALPARYFLAKSKANEGVSDEWIAILKTVGATLALAAIVWAVKSYGFTSWEGVADEVRSDVLSTNFWRLFEWGAAGALCGGLKGYAVQHTAARVFVRIGQGILVVAGGLFALGFLVKEGIKALFESSGLLGGLMGIGGLVLAIGIALVGFFVVKIVGGLGDKLHGLTWLWNLITGKGNLTDDEKAARKAARAFLMPFLVNADINRAEFKRLLADEAAYDQFHAAHVVRGGGRQQQSWQPPQQPPYYPPQQPPQTPPPPPAPPRGGAPQGNPPWPPFPGRS